VLTPGHFAALMRAAKGRAVAAEGPSEG
jgi:hypothetical protein